MSKIRISIREPLTIKCIPVLNVSGIDEFVERFVQDDNLIINDYRLPISNFIKHNDRIATFDGINWFDFGEIGLALDVFGGLNNIRVGSIKDDQDPLEL